MTEQERQMIQSLAARIQNAPPPQVDREADQLIRGTITRPDALYLLVQTVLIQDMALNQAKAQMDELKQRAGGSSGAPSGFLPNQPGQRPASPGNWGQESRVQQPPPQTAGPEYTGAGYQQQPAAPQQAPSGGVVGNFLRSAATTAAGVIAGETAFSALSSIFGHHGGYVGGSGFLAGAPVSPGSETVINNYYDDDREDRRSLAGGGDDDIRDIDDQGAGDDRDDTQNDDDQSDDDQADDVDDSSYDDNSNDDGSVDV